MPDTTWPENTVARYLTFTGAHVNIGEFDDYNRRTVTCDGCEHEHNFNGDPYINGLQADVRERDSLKECRRWAQAHAETCRAEPKPTT